MCYLANALNTASTPIILRRYGRAADPGATMPLTLRAAADQLYIYTHYNIVYDISSMYFLLCWISYCAEMYAGRGAGV